MRSSQLSGEPADARSTFTSLQLATEVLKRTICRLLHASSAPG